MTIGERCRQFERLRKPVIPMRRFLILLLMLPIAAVTLAVTWMLADYVNGELAHTRMMNYDSADVPEGESVETIIGWLPFIGIAVMWLWAFRSFLAPPCQKRSPSMNDRERNSSSKPRT